MAPKVPAWRAFTLFAAKDSVVKTSHTWHSARVAALRGLTPTVREFELAPETGGTLPYGPGAHLQIQLLVGQGVGAAVQTRSYSLTTAPQAGSYRIAVKRMDEGRGGSLAMWRLAVGDRLRIAEPQNHFALDESAKCYLLIAGGIGITPLVWMAQRLAELSARTGVAVKMLYGARSAEELAFLPTLEAALGPRLAVHLGPAPIDFATEIAALPSGAQLYTCGPVPMLEAVKAAWAQAGSPQPLLRFETFGSSGRLPTQAFRVVVQRQGIHIEVPANATLLDSLEMAGVQALSDCRRGECGLCVMDVLALDGEIDHRDVFLSAHEKQSNTRMCVCVSRVVGSVALDSAYRPD